MMPSKMKTYLCVLFGDSYFCLECFILNDIILIEMRNNEEVNAYHHQYAVTSIGTIRQL